MRKTKAKLELNLARSAKNNRRGFYRYVNQTRKVKEPPHALINNTGKLVTMGEGKDDVLNNFLPQFSMATSVFTSLEWTDSRMGTEGAKFLPW